MRSTKCRAEMEFVDVTAMDDAEASTSSNQSFGNINILKSDEVQAEYGTLELNQFILDGSKDIMPVAPRDVAYWSNAMSQGDCTFAYNPKIVIAFDNKHTSSGITLYFVCDYPSELVVTWRTKTGTQLMTNVFTPDALEYYCRCQVQNYEEIEIEFTKTRLPNQYIKLQKIIYGTHLIWEDDAIKSATVQEDIDKTSETLPINEAEISIVDECGEFNIENNKGEWKSVQKTQEVKITECVDDAEIEMGTYYIDDFSFSQNVAKFQLVDAIGLMDKFTFYDGVVYQYVEAGTVLQSIFAAAGITKYWIEDEVSNTKISGYLGIQSCREALRKVCFACGAVADENRTDTIKVYKPDRYVSSIVGPDRRFNGSTKISLKEYISGVSIECSKYQLEEELTEIFNDTLYSGDTKITFSEPYEPSSIILSNGSLKKVSTNYIVVHMDYSGQVMIQGRRYSSATYSVEVREEILENGETENIKTYSGCTLYNPVKIQDIAKELLKYNALRKKMEMRFLLNSEKVGNWASIRASNGKMNSTLIESQNIDLTGGYISNAVCTGYTVESNVMHYTGEIYAGGQWKGL